jgi:hypothetical protein
VNSVPRRVEIPKFPQGKRIAVTTSFDAGVVEDRRVIAANRASAFNPGALPVSLNVAGKHPIILSRVQSCPPD